MDIVIAHKYYNKEHLDSVMSDMAQMGAPVIRAIYDEANSVFVALEGCHRIRAAKKLGLTPIISEVNFDDVAGLALNDPKLSLDFDNDTLIDDFFYDAPRRPIIEFND